MLGEVGLELGNSDAGPVLEPRLVEIVLDPMQTSLAH